MKNAILFSHSAFVVDMGLWWFREARTSEQTDLLYPVLFSIISNMVSDRIVTYFGKDIQNSALSDNFQETTFQVVKVDKGTVLNIVVYLGKEVYYSFSSIDIILDICNLSRENAKLYQNLNRKAFNLGHEDGRTPNY